MIKSQPLDAGLLIVLDALVSHVRSILAHKFVGAYLVSSFAIGCGDENSDVDFAVVVEHELDEATIAALQRAHGEIFDLGPACAGHLECSYVPRATLKQWRQRTLWSALTMAAVHWSARRTTTLWSTGMSFERTPSR